MHVPEIALLRVAPPDRRTHRFDDHDLASVHAPYAINRAFGYAWEPRGLGFSMAISFEGQVAIVTGVGRGLGRAHALDLGRRGARVVVNDVAPEQADVVVGEVEAAGGTAVASYDSVDSPEGGRASVELSE